MGQRIHARSFCQSDGSGNEKGWSLSTGPYDFRLELLVTILQRNSLASLSRSTNPYIICLFFDCNRDEKKKKMVIKPPWTLWPIAMEGSRGRELSTLSMGLGL